LDPLTEHLARIALARRHRGLLRRQAHYLIADSGDTPDYVATLSDAEREELEQLVETARRLDAGELGACDACGRPLARERVRDTPWIRRCGVCGDH
jgi:RNA polymerase-binding transcription factor DksA